MKKLLLALCLFGSLKSFSQTTSATVGYSTSPFDSTFVVQSNTIDSFHSGNRPGAGPYLNGEILICEGATLKYDFMPGTSSGVTFYMEANAQLMFTQTSFDVKIYMKNGATLNGGGQQHYFKIKRVSSASVINTAVGSNISDSVFTNVNYLFPAWPSSVSPCNLVSATQNLSNEKKISLFPNPVSSVLYLKDPNRSNKSIQIFNALGQMVYQNDSFHANYIDVDYLKNGCYFIKIVVDGNSQVETFLKE